jgi:hypothetical protein
LVPVSSVIKVAPVKIEISSKINFLCSPNPGALIATTFTILRNLFKIKVAKASFSISCAIINNGRLVLATNSKIGKSSC